eukprot:6177296-Pleurochrysis_carterae.AAC.2
MSSVMRAWAQPHGHGRRRRRFARKELRAPAVDAHASVDDAVGRARSHTPKLSDRQRTPRAAGELSAWCSRRLQYPG